MSVTWGPTGRVDTGHSLGTEVSEVAVVALAAIICVVRSAGLPASEELTVLVTTIDQCQHNAWLFPPYLFALCGTCTSPVTSSLLNVFTFLPDLLWTVFILQPRQAGLFGVVGAKTKLASRLPVTPIICSSPPNIRVSQDERRVIITRRRSVC